jgi:hypothetical protein
MPESLSGLESSSLLPLDLPMADGRVWARCRFPVINWGLAFLIPTAFCCCTGLLAANLPMNAGFPVWSNGCMYTQATWKEAQYRQLAAKPNAKALIQSYSATGLRGPTNGVYSTSFFSCCNDPITLLYVLLCVEPLTSPPLLRPHTRALGVERLLVPVAFSSEEG